MVDRNVAVGAVVLVGLVLATVAGPAVGVAAAQAEDGEAGEEEEEGGIEGTIEEWVEGKGPVAAVGVLLVGVLVLTAAAEKLISYLTRASLGFRRSLFALAILFTGIEFDDTVLALVLSAGELQGVAMGTALGTALAITGVTLALAGLVQPFPVEIPRDYAVLLAVSPLVLVPFVLAGTLTAVHGVVLVGLFGLAIAYLLYRERERDVPVFRSTELGERLRTDGGTAEAEPLSEIPEDRLLGGLSGSGWAWLGLAVVALGGVVAGAVLVEAGSEIVIETFGIEETLFGATVLTLVLTYEDVLLTIEPVRRGVPEIGVGNVIGSVLFSVTANVGVITLLGSFQIDASVLRFHLPAVVVVTALAAYFLSTGRMKRWHGVVLGALYVAYWVVAVFVFGGVPISG